MMKLIENKYTKRFAKYKTGKISIICISSLFRSEAKRFVKLVKQAEYKHIVTARSGSRHTVEVFNKI